MSRCLDAFTVHSLTCVVLVARFLCIDSKSVPMMTLSPTPPFRRGGIVSA